MDYSTAIYTLMFFISGLVNRDNIKFQEKNLNLNRDSNSDLQISSLALFRVPVQVQIFLLKFYNVNTQRH